MAFWWVVGGMLVLVGAVVLRDKATRHKVLQTFAKRWGKGRKQSGAKAKARAHLRARRTSAKALPQATRPFERPRRSRLLATKCSAACRTSRKPAFDPKTKRLLCDCPCGGREHGMYRKGSTAQPKVATGTKVGTSGTKRVAAPASAPKPSVPAPVPTASGPTKRATTGTLDEPRRPTSPPVRPVSKTVPPPKPQTWRGLQQSSWSAMKAHAEKSPRCANGTFSAKTFKDRRYDPPRISQEMSCDTCGKAVS